MIKDRPGNRGKIIFVNRFAYPDHSATAQILTQVSEHLASQWHQIVVISSRAGYSGGGKELARQETVNGVRIYRTWTSRFGRQNLLGRAFDYLSFYASSFLSTLRHAGSGDVVVSKTDPPLLSVPLSLAARLKGARHVCWLQDIYPEVASALGVSLARGRSGRTLKWLRNRSLQNSAHIVAIGTRMRDHLIAEGIDWERISILQNFCRDDQILPNPPDSLALRKEWGFSEEEFIVGYSGNLGRAHDFETVLEAAALLKEDPAIQFLFVGGGHAHTLLAEAAKARGLDNICFKPYQPEARLSQSLSVPDVHWLSLKPEIEGLIVPFAAGGKSRDLAHYIRALKQDRLRCQTLGQNARLYLDAKASRAATLDKWVETMNRLAPQPNLPNTGA